MRIITIVSMIMMIFMAACGYTAAGGEVRGGNLREIVENQILDNVRESFGELEGQNFSWNDLERFTKDKVPEQIVTLLRANKVFLDAVDKVRKMPAEEREAYLRRCRLPLRKTWAEQGEISRKGTTDAGRKAELAIANAIVDLAEKLLGEASKGGGKER